MEIPCGVSNQGGVDVNLNLLATSVRINNGLASRWRNIWFRLLGVRLRGYIWMRRISIPRNWNDITLEAPASLDEGVVLLCSGPAKSDKLLIRKGTYINRHTMIDVSESLEIGEDCMIGPYSYLTDHDHGQTNDLPIKSQPLIGKPVRIGRNVWLGAGVIVLKGVTIGENAVVGAGAVVTRNVPPGAKVAGIPARQIRALDRTI
jgi:acetyltransferase-like isoleucine patch superfamily enzyme